MLSNRNLAIVALVLIVGAIGDGVLYSRPVASPAIYPIKAADTIELKYQDQLVLALRKADNESWLVTAPFHAPAIDSRVALLLDANYQTSRSYAETELKVGNSSNHSNNPQSSADNSVQPLFSDLFSDPVELRVNDHLFKLGMVEPVSQLRYVSANDRIYLQADYVIPLLQSPRSTFTNLDITKAVRAVSIVRLSDTDGSVPKQSLTNAAAVTTLKPGDKNAIANATPQQLSQWQNLAALTVVDAALLNQPPTATVTVEQSDNADARFAISRYQQLFALHPEQQQFAYLISQEQAEKLGICVYC